MNNIVLCAVRNLSEDEGGDRRLVGGKVRFANGLVIKKYSQASGKGGKIVF